MKRRTQGFSLLELVVVLAIFAVVALVGVQVIRQAVLTDRRLAEVSASSSEVTIALALLRRDMGAAIGLPFFTVTGVGEPALQIGQDGFALSVSGLGAVEGDGTGLGRAIWRFDRANGVLRRKVWTTLSPGAAQAAGPEVAMLSDVTGITVESFTIAAGWQNGYAPDPREPNALPRGLRVRLDHTQYGQIETLVALR